MPPGLAVDNGKEQQTMIFRMTQRQQLSRRVLQAKQRKI